MTTTELEGELPEIAENGFIIVSDFFAYQHESIVTAMKNSDIPHQIEFYPHNEKMLWREGAFRVYVAPLHLEAARDLCRATETAPVN
ncbi:hypothetical protein QUB75_04950 [Microcoleus sp. K1-B6]|uniref:hypothetical protein n=1 Tax=unclassified Microcoleus TaxID=2642155 RepID=UPI002FD4AE47